MTVILRPDNQEYYRRLLEDLISFASRLGPIRSIPQLLGTAVEALVHHCGFPCVVLVTSRSGWPAFCTASLPDFPGTHAESLASWAERRHIDFLGSGGSPRVGGAHPHLNMIEDLRGEAFGDGVRKVLEIPLRLEGEAVAALYLAVAPGEVPENLQSVMADACGRILETLLTGLTLAQSGGRDSSPSPEGSHLETLGRLVGGVAHDFNNLLQGMLGYTSLLAMQLGTENPKAQTYLQGLEQEVLKGGILTDKLLSMARSGPAAPELVNTSELIRETALLMERTIDRRIDIRLLLPDDPLPVRGVRRDLAQAVTLICLDARDSLPTGGRIDIGATRVDAAQVPFSGDGRNSPPAYVCIRVQDNGTAQTNGGRILQDNGEAGRGMQALQSILQRHQGFLAMRSQKGQGKSVMIYLPLAVAD